MHGAGKIRLCSTGQQRSLRSISVFFSARRGYAHRKEKLDTLPRYRNEFGWTDVEIWSQRESQLEFRTKE